MIALNNQWQQFATDFENRNNYVVGKLEIDRIKTRLSKFYGTGHVLELGCGNGTYTKVMADNAQSVTATDVSREMLNVCQKRLCDCDNVKTQLADGFNLPYRDNSFDTLFMANLLHVVPEQNKLLQECHRVLKPFGQVIVMSVTMYKMSLINRAKLLYRYHKTYGKKPAHSTVLTPDLCQSLFNASGFELKSQELLGTNTHALLCQGIKR